jgi:hypothetical protein
MGKGAQYYNKKKTSHADRENLYPTLTWGRHNHVSTGRDLPHALGIDSG